MRHALPLLAGATLLLGGCNLLHRDRDPGPHATRDYPVGAFTKLAVAGAYDVEVRTGTAPTVHAEGGQARLDAMEVKVDGDTLNITPRRGLHWSWGSWGSWGGHDKVKLVVTVPVLAGAEVAGSGDILVDHVATSDFKGEIAGSGNLKLARVETRSLGLEIAGSGSISASGKSSAVTYEIAGSGDIDAAGLVATTATVSIAGSGGIRANATQTAKIDVMGSGDVTLTGGAKCTIAKTGSGEVNCS